MNRVILLNIVDAAKDAGELIVLRMMRSRGKKMMMLRIVLKMVRLRKRGDRSQDQDHSKGTWTKHYARIYG